MLLLFCESVLVRILREKFIEGRSAGLLTVERQPVPSSLPPEKC
jgi:hypothetical protein